MSALKEVLEENEWNDSEAQITSYFQQEAVYFRDLSDQLGSIVSELEEMQEVIQNLFQVYRVGCVCVCVCVCDRQTHVCTHVHTHTHTSTPSHLHTHVHTHTHTFTHMCTHARTQIMVSHIGLLLSLRLQSYQDEIMNRFLLLLTIVTTVFIPAQFLTGLWGMNFDDVSHMAGSPILLSFPLP